MFFFIIEGRTKCSVLRKTTVGPPAHRYRNALSEYLEATSADAAAMEGDPTDPTIIHTNRVH